jgi:DnaJ-class molecular chaperone
VNCRLCRGAGRLALEASPPGEASFRVDVDCVGCKGAGRLTVIDRWVYGFGWD